MALGKHKNLTPAELYAETDEYKRFELAIFRKKIHQETRLQKHIYTEKDRRDTKRAEGKRGGPF